MLNRMVKRYKILTMRYKVLINFLIIVNFLRLVNYIVLYVLNN